MNLSKSVQQLIHSHKLIINPIYSNIHFNNKLNLKIIHYPITFISPQSSLFTTDNKQQKRAQKIAQKQKELKLKQKILDEQQIQDYNYNKQQSIVIRSNVLMFIKIYVIRILKYLLAVYSIYLGYQIIFTENMLDYYLDLLDNKKKVNLFTKQSLVELNQQIKQVIEAEYNIVTNDSSINNRWRQVLKELETCFKRDLELELQIIDCKQPRLFVVNNQHIYISQCLWDCLDQDICTTICIEMLHNLDRSIFKNYMIQDLVSLMFDLKMRKKTVKVGIRQLLYSQYQQQQEQRILQMMEMYVDNQVGQKLERIQAKIKQYYKQQNMKIEQKDYLYRHKQLFMSC